MEIRKTTVIILILIQIFSYYVYQVYYLGDNTDGAEGFQIVNFWTY